MTTWVDELEPGAPDIVAAWRGIESGPDRRGPTGGPAGWPATERRSASSRNSRRWPRRSRPSSAAMSGADLRAGWRRGGLERRAGDRADCDARAGLSLAAAKAAAGQWPPTRRGCRARRSPVRPTPTARRLLRKIAQSQRIVERSARTVTGHETDPCPLVHPLVGRLRCGEWLVFAGVHDLMHLEQLHTMMRR